MRERHVSPKAFDNYSRPLRPSSVSLREPASPEGKLFYLLLLLVRWSEYWRMEEILLSDSDMKAFSFSSNSWSAVLGAAGYTGARLGRLF